MIMITALDDEAYQIKGYDLQADEYVTKPFSIADPFAKIGAVLRSKREISKKKIQKIFCVYGNLRLDLAGYRHGKGQRSWSLSPEGI